MLIYRRVVVLEINKIESSNGMEAGSRNKNLKTETLLENHLRTYMRANLKRELKNHSPIMKMLKK